MVELHNYTPASGTKNKLLNWETLNSKVFPKMNFELAEEVIQDLVQAKPQGFTGRNILRLIRIDH